jgi:hypothetical protein
MKVTRRSDHSTAGHLLISVPTKQVEVVEAALTFLEHRRGKRASPVVIDLIIAAARRNGWQRSALHAHEALPQEV